MIENAFSVKVVPYDDNLLHIKVVFAGGIISDHIIENNDVALEYIEQLFAIIVKHAKESK